MGITPSRTQLIAVQPRVSSSALWPGAVRDGWSGAFRCTMAWLASLWHARWRSLRPLGGSLSASHVPCKRETREVSAVASASFWNMARLVWSKPFCWSSKQSWPMLLTRSRALLLRSPNSFSVPCVVGPSGDCGSAPSSGPGPPCHPVSCSVFFSNSAFIVR